MMFLRFHRKVPLQTDTFDNSLSEVVVPYCTMTKVVVPYCTMSEFVVPYCAMSEIVVPYCAMSEIVVPYCAMSEVVVPYCSISEIVVPYCAMKECVVLFTCHSRTYYFFVFVYQYLLGVHVVFTLYSVCIYHKVEIMIWNNCNCLFF
jgi:hypothetical protein